MKMRCYLGIIGHDKNIKILKNLLLNKSFPHILFHGASGTGKTSTILSLIDYICHGNSSNLMTIQLDALLAGVNPVGGPPKRAQTAHTKQDPQDPVGEGI